jgi:hydrogenase maturation protease
VDKEQVDKEERLPSSLVPCPLSALIIGLGNPLRRDDGVGVRVAELLAGRALSDGVQVVDGGTPGLELVNLLEGWPRVVLVDAANVGQEPGQFVRFTLDQVQLLGEDEHISVHGAGLRDALLLAQVLGVLPDQIVIFGVQPASLEWREGLSPEVEAALPDLLQSILKEVGGL